MKKAKVLLLITAFIPMTVSIASEQEYIGKVPFNCISAIENAITQDFIAEDESDIEGLVDLKKMFEDRATYACRSLNNPNVEEISWCDGTGCTGAIATYVNGACIVKDIWFGQDDQDQIDEEEFNANCMTARIN